MKPVLRLHSGGTSRVFRSAARSWSISIFARTSRGSRATWKQSSFGLFRNASPTFTATPAVRPREFAFLSLTARFACRWRITERHGKRKTGGSGIDRHAGSRHQRNAGKVAATQWNARNQFQRERHRSGGPRTNLNCCDGRCLNRLSLAAF